MQAKDLLLPAVALMGLALPAVAAETSCPPTADEGCSFSRCPPAAQVTPYAGPQAGNGYGFFVEADFTYWTAHEDGLAYAFVQDQMDTNSMGIQLPFTQVKTPSFDWRPGFKIGMGMSSCYDGWDLFLNYTWFRSNSNTSSVSASSASAPDVEDAYWLVNAPLIRGILNQVDTTPPWIDINTFNFYETANAKWGVQLNVFDLELGRNFYISRRLTLRPYVGLKAMWGRQNYTVAFDDSDNASSFFRGTTTMYNKIKNWGIGIRPGLDTAWHLGSSFSIVGELAFTALWEQFKVTRVDQSVTAAAIPAPFNIPAGTVTSGVNHGSNFYNLKPVIEWFLGFRWETWNSDESFHFGLDAGWEQQIWFSQNQFLRIEALDSDHGDLGLQGLTLRARMDF